tara:strand:+ start:1572 stop:1787 length:216 start_codon:yes stop_codon:yes gene_type:complete
MSTSVLPVAIALSSTILGGGMFLGANIDKINVLCQEMDTLKSDHLLLKEKVYDIHNKVCLIDQKLSTFLEK